MSSPSRTPTKTSNQSPSRTPLKIRSNSYFYLPPDYDPLALSYGSLQSITYQKPSETKATDNETSDSKTSSSETSSKDLSSIAKNLSLKDEHSISSGPPATDTLKPLESSASSPTQGTEHSRCSCNCFCR